MKNFVQENNIKVINERVSENPHMADSYNMDNYKSVLKFDNRQITLYYSKGYGHKGAEPTAEEILECLQMDINSVESSAGFQDWAEGLGYDTFDPKSLKKAEKIFNTILRQDKKLQNLLGDKYEEFSNIEVE